MTFGRSPHAAPSTGFGSTSTSAAGFDSPYGDGRADGFGDRGPGADGFGRPPALAAAASSRLTAGDIALGPASIELPPTRVGEQHTTIAMIINRGEDLVGVHSVEVTSGAFTASIQGSNVIPAGGQLPVSVVFAPTPPRLGVQEAVLTVELQNGARLTAPITARAELPAAAASPPSVAPQDDGAHRSARAPLWPGATPERCTPDNRGHAVIRDIRAVRVHNPGAEGEFRDPVATVLYPDDLVEITVDLAPDLAATAHGQIEDTAGLLAMRGADRRGAGVVLTAEAKRVGRTFTHLSIMGHGEEVARLPYQALTVTPALADADGKTNDSQRVKTTDIDSALAQVRVGIRTLFAAQKNGVAGARTLLQARRARPSLPWYAELFALAGEAVISTFTGGVGNRLGRALSGWTVGVRDLDLGRIPLFDWESAFGTGMKDSLKGFVRARIEGGGKSDGMIVDEPWAIEHFCSAQIAAFEEAALDLEGEFNNSAKAYKDLEAARPGLGLSAVEAHRHALAETRAPLRDESEQTTLREWFKTLAQATHGTMPSVSERDGSRSAESGGTPKAGGTDMGRAGRGHLVVRVVHGDPTGPVTAEGMGVAGIDGPAPHALTGSVGDLGLPVEVRLGTMVLRRNETGQLWIETRGNLAVLGGNLSRRDQAYLFAKGTGRSEWKSDAEMQAGVEVGADKVMAEVLGLPVRIP